VRSISDWLSLESEQALQEELRTEARNRIEGRLKTAGLDLPLRVAVGEIVATIPEEARKESADLIVLGRGGMHETLGGLRTHVHGIIQQSPCPVLSV
jgi:nucleotide-binding universal stress UspA family protein